MRDLRNNLFFISSFPSYFASPTIADENCKEILDHLQKTSFTSLKNSETLSSFSRLYDSFLAIRQTAFPGKDLLPQIALIAESIRGSNSNQFTPFTELALRFATLESEHRPNLQLKDQLEALIDLCKGHKEVAPGLILRGLWALADCGAKSKPIMDLWKTFISAHFDQIDLETVNLYTLFLRGTFKHSELTKLLIQELSTMVREKFSQENLLDKIFDSIEENLRLSKSPHPINSIKNLSSITYLTMAELKELAQKKVDKTRFATTFDTNLFATYKKLFSGGSSSVSSRKNRRKHK